MKNKREDKFISGISIGLPVYNGENFLKNKLENILNQSYKDFELIVSDRVRVYFLPSGSVFSISVGSKVSSGVDSDELFWIFSSAEKP